MTALPSPDDYSEVLVRDVMEATGKPEGQVRAVCACLSGPAMNDRSLQWQICNDYGWMWEELQSVLSLGAPNVEAIGKGIAVRGVAITASTQTMLARELAKGDTLDIDRAKAFSAIAKQQNDLARSWLAGVSASQHVHFHGGENIELLRMLREQKANERPRAEAVRETLRAAGHEV